MIPRLVPTFTLPTLPSGKFKLRRKASAGHLISLPGLAFQVFQEKPCVVAWGQGGLSKMWPKKKSLIQHMGISRKLGSCCGGAPQKLSYEAVYDGL